MEGTVGEGNEGCGEGQEQRNWGASETWPYFLCSRGGLAPLVLGDTALCRLPVPLPYLLPLAAYCFLVIPNYPLLLFAAPCWYLLPLLLLLLLPTYCFLLYCTSCCCPFLCCLRHLSTLLRSLAAPFLYLLLTVYLLLPPCHPPPPTAFLLTKTRRHLVLFTYRSSVAYCRFILLVLVDTKEKVVLLM